MTTATATATVAVAVAVETDERDPVAEALEQLAEVPTSGYPAASYTHHARRQVHAAVVLSRRYDLELPPVLVTSAVRAIAAQADRPGTWTHATLQPVDDRLRRWIVGAHLAAGHLGSVPQRLLTDEG